ncbi:histidine phosphatase family protein [Microlunatus elymi]|uniref:Histidine phosphatase family protein n=1 Tax=Microlunatus elymi TaxID=2596828 RepID=A0A516Q304_9ACTN|nr:histidine phosphatase family protein [Microlunatus elymi]QDP97810.1 histidine phosphatase family protein [Microlunatus elymi]
MTDLYVIRHGETEWSRDGRHTSITDLPLTDEGRRQASALNGHLDPSSFGLILASPRERSRETARLAGFTGDDEPVVDPELAEWNYGEYEGLTSEQIEEFNPGWMLWRDGCPGGESPEQVADRLTRVVDKVRASGVDRAIVFAHGHSLRVLTLCWLGVSLIRGDHFPLHTATISILGWEKGKPALQQWNAPVG